ncbi:MAG: carboxypeptidase regulatory-like domain-containing protein [Thermoleophilia bacterium]|nr:carboxypeptidase regulatory-like domain-containing protein [Thermoleophilia bacterium]
MTRYGMVIDVAHCIGCYNCFIACKDEHCGNDHSPYAAAQPLTGQTWMNVIETQRGQYPKVKVDYTAIPCMHCDDAPCVAASRDGAVYKRDDGIVIIDPVKAKGQKELVNRCPYRVIFWNEESQLPQKCTFCAHLLDAGWKEPRCVEACPTGALVFGDLDDPNSAISKLLASSQTEVLHPEFGLKEKVRYIGLPKSFIAGCVVLGDTDECAKGATVTLEELDVDGNPTGAKQTKVTDGFGDFEFDGLPANTKYKLTVSMAGYKDQVLEARTFTSVNLGDIVLSK